MDRKFVSAVVLSLAILAWGSVYADNITIWDESGSGPGWYGTGEDQEVEPGCITGQVWDLEAFLLDGSTLSMVGGYDFVNAVSGHNANTRAGDLFIDINGDAQFGEGAHAPADYNPYDIVTDMFGYDFVLDLNFAAMSYTAYDLTTGQALVQLTTVGEQINDAANPWRYYSGGTEVASGAIDYQTGLTDAQVQALGAGAVGGAHNLASIDLSWLKPYLDPDSEWAFLAHFTMECGNDNLIGVGNMPNIPEPTTLVLLGLGCFGALMRKRCVS